jgi:hypothetical protein
MVATLPRANPSNSIEPAPVYGANSGYTLVQGWRIDDSATLTEIGDIPAHETVIRIPKRLMPVFPEVNGGSGAP